MTKEFRSMRLAELCDIFSGFAFRSQDLVASGIPVLKIGNIQNKLVSEACADHFPEALFVKKLDRYTLARGDTLVAMTGAGSVGKFGRMPWTGKRFLVNQRVGIIRPHSPICDPDFVYYSLSLEKYERTLYGYGMGAGQPNVSASQIGSLEISLPSIATQRRIASILSAYDDLIENNTRRIAILEEMARRLYEEWFVRFRFPGHEGVRLVESELGLVPEGWSCTDVADAVQRFGTGQKYDIKSVASSGCIPVLDQGRQGVIGYHDDAPGFQASISDPVIVFANHTCYQRLIYFPFSTIQNVIPYKASAEFQRSIYWLYHATLGLVSLTEYKGHWPQFAAKKITIPPASVAKAFGTIVRPLHEMVYTLTLKNQNLRTTRDLLLPKLISGELDVSTLPEPQAETA